MTAGGTFRVLYRFKGGTNGCEPMGLVAFNGSIYGAADGGKYKSGQIFRISPAGNFQTVYSFKGSADGASPADLTVSSGLLYGLTLIGGDVTGPCGRIGCGTVFSLDATGGKRTLHRFYGHPQDGSAPNGSLLAWNGNLYGVTNTGGSHDGGVLYSISPSGREAVLHNFEFSNGPGPTFAEGELTDLNGKLYGGAERCGSSQTGCIYALTPP